MASSPNCQPRRRAPQSCDTMISNVDYGPSLLQFLSDELLIALVEHLEPVSVICFSLTPRKHYALVTSILSKPLKMVCLRPDQRYLKLSGDSRYEQLMYLLCSWMPLRHLQKCLVNHNGPDFKVYKSLGYSDLFNYHYHLASFRHAFCARRDCPCHKSSPKFFAEYAESVIRIETNLGLIAQANGIEDKLRRRARLEPKDAADARFTVLARTAFAQRMKVRQLRYTAVTTETHRACYNSYLSLLVIQAPS
jgi:hypothetical protein